MLSTGLINLLLPFLAVSLWQARLWYAIPLVLVVSLVYGATRHERMKEIIEQFIRTAIGLIGFMSAIFVVIWLVGFWN
ncbi:MAG: hypothetical protein ACK5Z0_00670 [Planctomycetota bacterium]|jgi:hypothetical protein